MKEEKRPLIRAKKDRTVISEDVSAVAGTEESPVAGQVAVSETEGAAASSAAAKSSFAYEFVSVLLSAALIILIIFCFFARLAGVVGNSMNPTLENGNWVVMSQLGASYEPEYGDIVVISQPNALDEVIIKRVIATGGQTIDIDFEKGIVYVDGQKLEEPYILEPTYLEYNDGVQFPLTVPEGYVFVMGDNRNDSTDSRSSLIGLIRNEYILGKVVCSVGNGIHTY